MSKVWTIATRDFRSYFTSPIAYILIGGFLTLMGFMFFQTLQHFVIQNVQYSQYNMGKSITISEGIIRPFYGNMNVVLLLFVPLITMRLFAEEKKLHTIELLMTSPITLTQMVLGKFISAILFVLVLLVVTGCYPLTLILFGNPDLGPIFTNFLGTLLMTSCYVSLGVLFSAMTDNQIVAAAMTFATCLFLWLISWAAQSAGPTIGEFLNYISLVRHYYMSFSQGVINTSSMFFYFSFIFFFLFLAQRFLDSYRWR